MHTLVLPASVCTLEFISDLHLDPSHPATFQVWQEYMQTSQADVIFILGDLFESWVGDDILQAVSPLGDFERKCVQVMAQATSKIYFMHGNRDFLIAQGMADASHMTLLPDPALLSWQGEAAILSHGDLLCIDDVEYQKTRLLVRTPQWQMQVLNLPLQQRIMAAQQLREKSIVTKQNNASEIMDASELEVLRWFEQEEGVSVMIHGHTHRPKDHVVQSRYHRLVLSDWDMDDIEHPRAQVLRWEKNSGFTRIPLV